jgi:hypothetical protein
MLERGTEDANFCLSDKRMFMKFRDKLHVKLRVSAPFDFSSKPKDLSKAPDFADYCGSNNGAIDLLHYDGAKLVFLHTRVVLGSRVNKLMFWDFASPNFAESAKGKAKDSSADSKTKGTN